MCPHSSTSDKHRRYFLCQIKFRVITYNKLVTEKKKKYGVAFSDLLKVLAVIYIDQGAEVHNAQATEVRSECVMHSMHGS